MYNQMSYSSPRTQSPSTPSNSTTHPFHSSNQPATAQTYTPTALQPPKEYDLILEFPERPYDRWLVPRVPVVCERVPSTGNIEAILLLFALPFPKQKPQTQTTEQSQSPETKTTPS